MTEWGSDDEADGYRVQWKSGMESYSTTTRNHVLSGRDKNTYTITGLVAGTEYTVRVLGRLGGSDGPTEPETITNPETGMEETHTPYYGEATGTPLARPAPLAPTGLSATATARLR